MKKEHLYKIFLLIFNLIVILKLINITIINKDYYQSLNDNLTNKTFTSSSAPRGRILDAKGKILVDNIGVKTLVYKRVKDMMFNDEIKIAKTLANILEIDNINVSELDKRKYYYLNNPSLIDKRVKKDILDKYSKRKITKEELLNYKYNLVTENEINSLNVKEVYIYNKLNNGYSYQNKIIKTNITEEELNKINENNLKGIYIDIKWQRKYNYDTCLNDLFGSIGAIEKENKEEYLKKGYAIDDTVGVSFLEKYYEDILRGKKAIYQVNSDSTLSVIEEEKRGNDIVLSIDIEKQLAIEDYLKEQVTSAKKYPSSKYYNGSYIVVSNVLTGGIVSIAGINYNEGIIKGDVIGTLTNSYTVGSVVKGASQTVGYYYNVIDKEKKVQDGCIKLYSQKEKCSWTNLGKISDIDALTYSSNYYQFLNAIKVSGYTYQRNMKFTPTKDDFNKYRNIFKQYGLGVKTGIDLYEEQIGIEGNMISGDLLLNLSIGQFDTYTPLMLNQYIATIANNGERLKLRLVDYGIGDRGEKIEINNKKILNNVNIENEDLKRIQNGLHNVIIKGTGAGYVNKKYDAAGKTGTSETFYNGKSTTTKSFIMYAPYTYPEYAIVIISPNLAYKNSTNNYKYPINSKLSKEITNILFEK